MDKALLVCTSCTAAGAHSLYLHKKKRKRKKKKKQWSHMTTTLSQNLRICEEGLRKLGCKEKNRNQTNKQSKSVSNKRPHVDSYRIYFRFSGRKEDRPIRQKFSLRSWLCCLSFLLLRQELDACCCISFWHFVVFSSCLFIFRVFWFLPCVCFFRFYCVGLLVYVSAGDLKQPNTCILLYSVVLPPHAPNTFFLRLCWFLLYC